MRCLFVLACLVCTAFGIENESVPAADDVIVKKLRRNILIPITDSYLWNKFANKDDETKFNEISTENWEKKYELFADALLKKAKSASLHHQSLSEILKKIKSDASCAYLPIGAYSTKTFFIPIWIVVVKWEYAREFKRLDSKTGEIKKRWTTMAHIKIFAYTQKNRILAGFNTCS